MRNNVESKVELIKEYTRFEKKAFKNGCINLVVGIQEIIETLENDS